jgi:hypothetical protein
VSWPFAAFGDQELFPDLTAKVAAQIHAISSYHPFVDGNKRTADVSVCVSKVNRVVTTSGLSRKNNLRKGGKGNGETQ